MIKIKPSTTADTRTCDYANVTKDTLLDSSRQHIDDVWFALQFFAGLIASASAMHDRDKIDGIDQFYSDFVGGFKNTTWWDNHRRVSRHHLIADDGIPKDVNLIDVLEMIADCVMAGMARSGVVTPVEIKPDVLMAAFRNTVDLLIKNVEVTEHD